MQTVVVVSASYAGIICNTSTATFKPRAHLQTIVLEAAASPNTFGVVVVSASSAGIIFNTSTATFKPRAH